MQVCAREYLTLSFFFLLHKDGHLGLHFDD